MNILASTQRKIVLFAALIVLFGPSPARAQNAENAPSFQDTMKYITGFLQTHGCTEWRNSSGSHRECIVISQSDSCVLGLGAKDTITWSDGSEGPSSGNNLKIDLSILDPASLKVGPVFHEDHANSDNGLAVLGALSQTGGPGLTLPVDSAENAQHLINALSHAITLCGGKKAAF
jgi:hypothetical protein